MLIVSRPNKLQRRAPGDLVDQIFYYDGKTLTLYNAVHNVYAIDAAPGTIEEMLDFARESLGLSLSRLRPGYRNCLPAADAGCDPAIVVGKEFIGGVKCDHLLFSRPGVDFQVWVADGGSAVAVQVCRHRHRNPRAVDRHASLSDWNVAPAVADAQFTFCPPQGDQDDLLHATGTQRAGPLTPGGRT